MDLIAANEYKSIWVLSVQRVPRSSRLHKMFNLGVETSKVVTLIQRNSSSAHFPARNVT
jgi:hypothetical protein